MRTRVALRTCPGLLQAIQLLLLLVAAGGALGRGHLAGAASHCARHSMEGIRPAERSMDGSTALRPDGAGTAHLNERRAHPYPALPDHDGPPPAAWGHECSHCPPAECTTQVPCGFTPSTQSLLGAAPGMESEPARAVREEVAARRASSVFHTPPTPPPQAGS